jgi:hypothetical protein
MGDRQSGATRRAEVTGSTMTPQDHGWSSLLVAVALVGAYFTIDGAQPYAIALLVALVPVDVYFRFVRSVPT